jgi:hypothetical protein
MEQPAGVPPDWSRVDIGPAIQVKQGINQTLVARLDFASISCAVSVYQAVFSPLSRGRPGVEASAVLTGPSAVLTRYWGVACDLTS